MTVISNLINFMQNEDYQKIADCFADSLEVKYIDYCPAILGQQGIYLYGKNAIEMFFRNAFYPMNHTFSIAEPNLMDNRTATLFACYQGRYIYSRLTIEKVNEREKIIKAVMRPE